MVLSALWATPVGNLAGVGRHLLDVAGNGIPGVRLTFLAPPGDLAEALSSVGAAVIPADFGPDYGLRSSVRSLRHAVTRLRPHVVHTHLGYADIASALATAGLPVTLVSTEHGIAADDLVYHGTALRSRAMAAVHTARLRRFSGVIAVSDATRAAIIDKWRPRTRIDVIRNGVDRPPEPHQSAGLRIASLARLAPEKRIDKLLDAFALLARRHNDATLTIAGDGPLSDALRAKARPLGDRVRFLGHVPADDVLRASDVVVQLSTWENCSYALLDAMAYGLGVVATPVGGNTELLPLQCLVDAGDSASVAGAIERQALQRDTRPRLGDWPDVESMCARIARFYDAVQQGEVPH